MKRVYGFHRPQLPRQRFDWWELGRVVTLCAVMFYFLFGRTDWSNPAQSQQTTDSYGPSSISMDQIDSSDTAVYLVQKGVKYQWPKGMSPDSIKALCKERGHISDGSESSTLVACAPWTVDLPDRTLRIWQECNAIRTKCVRCGESYTLPLPPPCTTVVWIRPQGVERAEAPPFTEMILRAWMTGQEGLFVDRHVVYESQVVVWQDMQSGRVLQKTRSMSPGSALAGAWETLIEDVLDGDSSQVEQWDTVLVPRFHPKEHKFYRRAQ